MRWLTLLPLLLLSCKEEDNLGSPCGPRDALVVGVLDGDTVDLASGVRLRYLLVDAPEIAHGGEPADCFGDEAKAENEQLVLGRAVTLEYDVECEDRFDRTLAYVFLGDRMINRILVERGFGRVLQIEPNGADYIAEFRALEANAEQAGAGLWGACP